MQKVGFSLVCSHYQKHTTKMFLLKGHRQAIVVPPQGGSILTTDLELLLRDC